jgi:hypothetical protein
MPTRHGRRPRRGRTVMPTNHGRRPRRGRTRVRLLMRWVRISRTRWSRVRLLMRWVRISRTRWSRVRLLMRWVRISRTRWSRVRLLMRWVRLSRTQSRQRLLVSGGDRNHCHLFITCAPMVGTGSSPCCCPAAGRRLGPVSPDRSDQYRLRGSTRPEPVRFPPDTSCADAPHACQVDRAAGRNPLTWGRRGRHQPRARHSGRDGRSLPSVESLPCPG